MGTQLYDITNWPKQGLDETKYPLIGTIDATPKIGRVLEVAGRQYRVGILSHKDRYAGVHPSIYCQVCGKSAARYEPGCGWMHFTKKGSVWHKEKPG